MMSSPLLLTGMLDRAARLFPNVEIVSARPDGSRDRYVLLDAQDWMTNAQLEALWTEITRTARPGARVIFRRMRPPARKACI